MIGGRKPLALRFQVFLIYFCLFLLPAAMAVPAAPMLPCKADLRPVQKLKRGSRINEIVDQKGALFSLAGLHFPDNLKTDPPSRAKQKISAFLKQAGISIAATSKLPDRYGRRPVQVFARDETGSKWLQGELVRAGLAIVRPQSEEQDCGQALLDEEQKARIEKVGIWRWPELLVFSSNDQDLVEKVDAYRIVEGRILSTGKARNVSYLNFGTNWQSDFTVTVAKRHLKRFNNSIGSLGKLKGKYIRVRGWMVSRRGPMIEVYHSGQIEIIAD